MIEETIYKIDPNLYSEAVNSIPLFDERLTLNEPTGRFFYEPWTITSVFKGTIWDTILKTLPNNIGEARLIKLVPGKCYYCHSDIDDRYHLPLTGNKSYLINLDDNQMHLLENTGKWYDMNTEFRHTAANFGDMPRIQLVVRKLLRETFGYPSQKIVITLSDNAYHSRYYFDDNISPLLNRWCKLGIVHSFSVDKNIVIFNLHKEFVQQLVEKSCEKCKITSI